MTPFELALSILKRAVLVTVIAAIFFFLARECGKVTPSTVGPLQGSETARITLNHRTATVQTKESVKAVYVPQSGKATFTVTRSGETILSVKNKGVSCALGVGLGYSDAPRAVLDVQAAYWNRGSLHVGLAAGKAAPAVVPYTGIGYALDQLNMDNTTLVLGKVVNQHFLALGDGWLVALRLGF